MAELKLCPFCGGDAAMLRMGGLKKIFFNSTDAPTCVEAAHLMGYEIVEDTIKTVQGHEPLTAEQQKDMAEFIDSKLKDKEEANMDKPLKDWTLGECQEYCGKKIVQAEERGGYCETYCGLYKRGICKNNWCSDWDLAEKPRWTEQEVKRAEAILALWPNATILEDGRPYDIRVHGKDRLLTSVPLDLFPSLGPGQSVKLSEICGNIHDGEGGE